MMEKPVAYQIAATAVAHQNCVRSGNSVWRKRHKARLDKIERECLPYGTRIVSATANELVFETSYHHMNEHGYYCGWSYHLVNVTSTFLGLDVQIVDSSWDTEDEIDREASLDYIAETFEFMLSETCMTHDDRLLTPKEREIFSDLALPPDLQIALAGLAPAWHNRGRGQLSVVRLAFIPSDGPVANESPGSPA